jgi:hypothetical protein
MPGDVLADRVRAALAGKRVTEQQRMFRGTFVMLNGNMTVGASPRRG